MEPLIGEIKLFPGNFAPQGWLTCEGQSLSISEYDVLFSLLGTTYGGNGTTTFNLPDLRGAFPTQCTNISSFHPGGTYSYGQTGGYQNTTITAINLPPHTHTIVKGGGTNLQGSVSTSARLNVASTNTGSVATPSVGNSLSGVTDISGLGDYGIYNAQAPNTALNSTSVRTTVNNSLNFDPTGLTMTPYGSGPTSVGTVPNFVAMQYIIAVEGNYPSRP